MLIYLFIPHFFLFFSILMLLIFNSIIIRSRKTHSRLICIEVFAQTATVVFAVLLLVINSKAEGFSTDYNFKIDFGKNLVQIISVSLMLFSLPSVSLSFRSQNLNFFEFYVILLIVLCSLFFIINSNSLLAIFVVVEIYAICSIILVAFNKMSAFSTEAGLKYFISSAAFSGVLLLGVSLLYISYGTICFDKLFLLSSSLSPDIGITIRLFMYLGIVLVTCWLLFKLTVAPFHHWVSDVYDGAPLASTIFLSVVPKFALIIFLLKWIKIVFSLPDFSNYYHVFIVCGVISSLFGFFVALKQSKLKKIFIFSSMGQMGYIVVASFAGFTEGCISVITFSLIYFINSIIVWNMVAVFVALDKKVNIYKKKKDFPMNLTFLKGLYLRNKPLAILVCLLVFSLSSIPPMIGFFGKFEVFSAITDYGLYMPIALIIILSSISTYYYLELVRSIFFEGDLSSVKNHDDYKFVSMPDWEISLVNYISCFLSIILIFGIIYPEFFTTIATLITYYNDL